MNAVSVLGKWKHEDEEFSQSQTQTQHVLKQTKHKSQQDVREEMKEICFHKHTYVPFQMEREFFNKSWLFHTNLEMGQTRVQIQSQEAECQQSV